VGAGLFYFAHPPSVDARTGERVMSIGRPMWTPDAMLPTVSPTNRVVVNETLAQFGLHPCGMPTRETHDAPVQLPPQVAGRPNASISGVISVVVSEASLFKVVGGALRGDFVGIGGYTTSARLRGRLDALALEDVTDIPEAAALTAAAGYPQSLLQPFKQAPPAFPVGRGLPFLAAVHRGNHPFAGGRWNYSRSIAFRPLNSADARLATPQAQELRATGGIDSLRLAPNASAMARLFYPSVATQGVAETGPTVRHRSSWVVGWGGRLLLVSAVSVAGHVYANTSSNAGLLAVSVVSATLAAIVMYTLLLLLYLRRPMMRWMPVSHTPSRRWFASPLRRSCRRPRHRPTPTPPLLPPPMARWRAPAAPTLQQTGTRAMQGRLPLLSWTPASTPTA